MANDAADQAHGEAAKTCAFAALAHKVRGAALDAFPPSAASPLARAE
jgi:hypothetical protein